MTIRHIPSIQFGSTRQARLQGNQTADALNQQVGSVSQNTGDLGSLQAQINSTTNSNGSYTQSADGTIDAWGTSGAVPTGSSTAVLAITFPIPFTSTPTVVCGPDNRADGTGNFPFVCFPDSITTTGFRANLSCPILIGGSGAGGITNTVHVMWMAKGK